MAAKKIKISSTKRAAHLRGKKKTLTKSQQQRADAKGNAARKANLFSKNFSNRSIPKRSVQTPKTLPQNNPEDDADMMENVADMLDGDDLELLQTAGVNKKRKRKHVQIEVDAESIGLEKKYSTNTSKENETKKIRVGLLPIKSREGEIITRTAEVDYQPKPKVAKAEKGQPQEVGELEPSEYEDSDEDILNDNVNRQWKDDEEKKLLTTTDLLILREQEIEKQKFRIGIICSGILEKPEDKLRNFNALFELMDENNSSGTSNFLTVRKMAIISITEIFKDILPEYRVGQVDTKMTTVRKATLERVNYENSLLNQFKKFLQRLEQLTAAVTKRGFGRITLQSTKMAEVAVSCLCELLKSHPYFNYVQNIAQLLVYMLNCRYPRMRMDVNECFRTIFATDKKLDMTLFIVRRINHLIKTKANHVHVDVLTCLLSLKIKGVNLDIEKENELKQKKLESHRQRLINLSKKERKRRKRLVELNRELEETRAEENKQVKQHKLTEITKMVFTIYFRILKNDPTSKILSTCLEGLSEFAHVINVEYFSDLISVLNNILETTEMNYDDQLHCIRTIFVILSGQGEVLNIDPMRFYRHFYKNMLTVHAGKNHGDFQIILRTLDDALLKRRKNITQQRLLAFIKRLSTISMQLLHNGVLASLGVVKMITQLTSAVHIMLDLDASVGSGRYDPELEDPEYSNASCTSLYELASLQRHYHPTVRQMAHHIAVGVPATGEGSLPSDISKLAPEELYEKYDSSEMAFNPVIPVPKRSEPKSIKWASDYADVFFKPYYLSILNENNGPPHASRGLSFYLDVKQF